MRCIDADELDKALEKECEDCIHNQYDCEECDFLIARLYINAAPTIEAKPVKHAHRTLNIGLRSYCSNCGVLAYCENFCSNCGAYIIKKGDIE